MGYFVICSAASLGPFDLVAIGRSDFLLLQVKCNRLPAPAEREGLTLFAAPPNTRKLCHVWTDYQREPRVIEL